MLRKLSVGLLILGILLFANVSFAEEVCLSEENAAKIVVELERANIMKEELQVLKDQNAELYKQVKLMKEIVELQNQQLEASKKTVEVLQDTIKAQGEAYEKQLKQSKPNMMYQILEWAGFIGVGILIGLAL